MLPSWIIEEIKKREQGGLRRDDRPRIELPLERPPPPQRPSKPPVEDPDGDHERDEAVVVIDLN
jgi:hypothetical protein